MSADNIGYCPRCKRKMGLRKLEKASDAMPNEMREYYGISLSENGVFTVDYEAECHSCGFTWNYSVKHTLTDEELK